MSDNIARIDPQDLPEVERLRELIGVDIYTDHLSNALAAFARGEGKPAGRLCCGVAIDHDHGDCDGYIFTARDYWTGVHLAVSHEADEHVATLYAHGPYRDHCRGYAVHAWPCYPASIMLSDLRELVGAETWARADPFGRDR